MFSEKNKLLLDTYQRFIDIVLGLCEPDTLENIMLSDAMGFGTTTDEKIFGVEAFLKVLKFQNEQSKGLDFKWKVEPVSRYISLSEDLAAFADDIYLNFEVNGEKIEMYLRTSIILEYRDDKWLVIHWHGSKPEEVQSEEDTFGIETWKQKVETLEKQVAERTADLVEKNKELEVEASLERVRSVAMSMQKSTELADTASILFQQIKEFGFETWSCGFCIWKEDDIVEVWMGADSSGLLPPMKIPYIEEPTHHDIYNASLTGADSHEKIWEGGALEEHYNFLRKVPSVAVAIKQLDEAGLSLPTKQCYYVGFFKQGYLLLITKEPNAEIHKKQKSRQEKQRLNWHWKEFAPERWPCSIVMNCWMQLLYYFNRLNFWERQHGIAHLIFGIRIENMQPPGMVLKKDSAVHLNRIARKMYIWIFMREDRMEKNYL